MLTGHRKSVREMDAYPKSLFTPWGALQNSLFFKGISLIVCLGNLLKSPCGTAVSSFEIAL